MKNNYIEQIIRPTGLIDPECEIRSTVNQVEDLMRDNLKKNSYVLWRKRAKGRKTKHIGLREFGVGRHHSYDQHKYKK